MGTACFVKGAEQVLDRLKELLAIDVGGTTSDGLFSIDLARCVGACALAPVMLVDDTVYAGVKPGQLTKILAGHGYVAKKAGAASRREQGRGKGEKATEAEAAGADIVGDSQLST